MEQGKPSKIVWKSISHWFWDHRNEKTDKIKGSSIANFRLLYLNGRIVEAGSHVTAQSGLVEYLPRVGVRGGSSNLATSLTMKHRTERLKQPEAGLKINVVSLSISQMGGS